jgi:hypothetical protein
VKKYIAFQPGGNFTFRKIFRNYSAASGGSGLFTPFVKAGSLEMRGIARISIQVRLFQNFSFGTATLKSAVSQG